MKLPQLEVDGETIIWAHKSQRATVAGVVSLLGVLPLLILVLAPYATVFYLVVANLVLDIYRTKKRAARWTDLLRKLRLLLTAGYWRLQSRHRTRQSKRTWNEFKGTYHP